MKLLNFISILVWCAVTQITFVRATEEITLTAGPLSCSYKNKDLNEEYDPSTDITIKCSDSTCTSSGPGVSVSGAFVNITEAGTYILEGSLKGQVSIAVGDEDFVHLVLNGISITSSDGPAIYGVNADKITITLVGDNTLTDTNHYSNVVDEEPDACLFIDSDLSINGSGALTVTGNYGDAIRCKKDLKIVRGNITVPSALQRGIKVKNSICVKDGTVDVTSTNTAIKVTRDDDAEKGFIVIDGGNIAVSSDHDGIHAETHLTINGGFVDVKKSVEGIEGQMIDILGGEIHVVASDDGFNASKISSDSDESTDSSAMKGGMPNGPSSSSGSGSGSDGSVYINIVGGKVYVTVSGNDVDGIDSNGVLYIGGDAEVYSSISGGDIYGNMAALDADGSNSIVGGATVIATAGSMGGNGMENNGDNKKMGGKSKRQGPGGFQDSERQPGQQGQGQGQPNGGNMGGMGGMGEESGSIYQPYIQTSVNSQEAGTTITVKDSNDHTIATYTPDVSYTSLLITSPSMKAGETYTIITGEDTTTATASEGANGSVDSPSVASSVISSSEGSLHTSDGVDLEPKNIAFFILILSIIIFC